MFVEGTQAALAQPEFREVEKLSQFLATLQERAALLEMLGQAVTNSTSAGKTFCVQMRIGEEWGKPELTDYSIVSTPYYIGTQERGTIGVVGPTRMDYARAAAAVELMARTMSELLTQLTV
jgi:heat-inducible transcriptional repressor